VLARAESGEPPRVDVVEVRPLLQEIVREVQPAPGVEVSVACDSALAIIAEPNLAHEALAAILDNAVEHTKHGTIRLEAAQANGVVSVAVTDRGGGILPEHRERIFEPFYRPSADGEGYGLGLAIAAQAAHAMGGALRVDDAPGGTRFTLELPSASRAQ
jgi:signal transduction histidine kinase